MTIRTILISSVSRGIVHAIAKRLLGEGYRISLGLRKADLFETKLLGSAHSSDQLFLYQYDATLPTNSDRWVKATVDRFAYIDSLIHCAEIHKDTPLLFADGQEKDLKKFWRINIMGPWWLTRSSWPYLIIQKNARIQVLVSMSGKRAKGPNAGYPVSKFGLMALCQSIRNEG